MKNLLILSACIAATIATGSLLQAQEAAPDLGAMPNADQFPQVEFVFEEHVTLAPATVLGETALGHRQYIPITGGTIAGPKLQGRVIPGGCGVSVLLWGVGGGSAPPQPATKPTGIVQIL
jgi:hypothetical protein